MTTNSILTVRLEDGHHGDCVLGTFDPANNALNANDNWKNVRVNPTLEPAGGVCARTLITDSLPDLWGRKVARLLEEARSRRNEVKPRAITDALLLACVADSNRMGALRFAKPSDPEHYLGQRRYPLPRESDLPELASIARRIESDDILSAATLEVFAENATALGGSRPKASFVDAAGRLWLAKFPSIDDDRDKGAWEYAMVLLAAEAGIRVPNVRLIDIGDARGRIFASRRFDRTENGARRHYLSVRALLGASDNREPRSYRDLVSLIDRICFDPEKEKEELWRRTVFKCLIHDGDDHLRNQGFLLTERGWELSPAFDLNASLSKTHLTLTYNGGRRDLAAEALLAGAKDWGIDQQRAREIFEDVKTVLADWKKAARELSISEEEIERLQPAFEEIR